MTLQSVLYGLCNVKVKNHGTEAAHIASWCFRVGHTLVWKTVIETLFKIFHITYRTIFKHNVRNTLMPHSFAPGCSSFLLILSAFRRRLNWGQRSAALVLTTTWTLQLLTSLCSPNFALHLEMHTSTPTLSVSPQPETCPEVMSQWLRLPADWHALQKEASVHVRTLTYTHTQRPLCMQGHCTCLPSWIVLPLPHFVLPVHQLHSSLADSWKSCCGTLLSVCVKGSPRPAAWRRLAHPPSAEPPVLSCDS